MLDIKHEGPVSGWDTEPDGDGDDVLDASPSTATDTEAQAELAAATKQLEHHADAMAVIEIWRHELHTKLARARLRFELIGMSDEEHDELRAEVGRFKELCQLLRWLGRWST
jgi:hypothetical protein